MVNKKIKKVKPVFHKVRPLKRLGQNFLIDRTVVKKMLSAAEVGKQDTILEIGPGLGALTKELAKKAGWVIAIEKDKRMVEILKETLKDFDNIKIVQGDILNPPPLLEQKWWGAKQYIVVANLPFYITAPVIRKFLEAKHQPQLMVLLVQKEVAQRICARPPKMNILAVSVQVYARPKIISPVSKKSFWPQPKVDGAIIKITRITNYELRITNKKDVFFKIVKAGFAHPRKQLANNLSSCLKMEKGKVKTWLVKNKIQPAQRAETLTVENWLRLTKTFMLK